MNDASANKVNAARTGRALVPRGRRRGAPHRVPPARGCGAAGDLARRLSLRHAGHQGRRARRAGAAAHSRAFLRFDYSGHGESDGRFEDGTISLLAGGCARRHRRPAGRRLAADPGSAPPWAAWLALLAARALAPGRHARSRAWCSSPPAPDFTERLILPGLDAAARARDRDDRRPSPALAIRRAGVSDHAGRCSDDGRRHLLLDGVVRTHAPRAHPAGDGRPGRALAHRNDADRAPSRRRRRADPDQGRRPPPVSPRGTSSASSRPSPASRAETRLSARKPTRRRK